MRLSCAAKVGPQRGLHALVVGNHHYPIPEAIAALDDIA